MKTRGPGRPKADEARDLKAELLRTSRTMLNEGGPSALSMREVARRTGCTHQAPYHHFENREAILAALVTEGFRELTERLRTAHDQAEGKGPRATFEAAGKAYIGFALDNPGVFRIMFRPDMCNPESSPSLLEASGQAHAELERLTRTVYGQRSTTEHEVVIWSHVHGLAGLLLDSDAALAFPTTQERSDFAQKINQLAASLLTDDPGTSSGQ